MEFTPIRPIEPLWAAPVEEKEAEAAPAGSVFADIFQIGRASCRERV